MAWDPRSGRYDLSTELRDIRYAYDLSTWWTGDRAGRCPEKQKGYSFFGTGGREGSPDRIPDKAYNRQRPVSKTERCDHVL